MIYLLTSRAKKKQEKEETFNVQKLRAKGENKGAVKSRMFYAKTWFCDKDVGKKVFFSNKKNEMEERKSEKLRFSEADLGGQGGRSGGGTRLWQLRR